MRNLRIAAGGLILALFVVGMTIVSAKARVGSEDQFDHAAAYKAKCVACHGQKAEKKFDTSLPDEQLIDAVMKGKKSEKPPNMPAYGEKGITPEQAKALVEHMKQLKSAP